MPRINIRCCCDPTLVLGTVNLPATVIRRGCVIFPLSDGDLELSIAEAYRACVDDEETYRAWGDDEEPARELALKSDDTPLEVLRRISGFVEVNRHIPVGSTA